MRFGPRLLTFLVVAILAASALLIAACGNDDDSGADDPGTGNGDDTAATDTPADDTDVSEGDRADASGSITVYSGRSEELIGPIIDRFEEDTGIQVNVRYGDTPELAATILEEGSNTPADVYIAQDAGSLGLLANENMLAAIPGDILGRVGTEYRAENDTWVGLSGRARVVAYNTEMVDPDELPGSILDFTDPEWEGRIGWAPTNASFQSFVTGLRVVEGEDTAREWLEGIRANNPREYPNNTSTVEAVASGEVEVGFVNHYYLFRFLEERGEEFESRNYYFEDGDIGGLMNVAGTAILQNTDNQLAAERFIEYMLEEEAQDYFATETFEFPLVTGVEVSFDVPALGDLDPVAIDLTDLEDLRGTIELLQETGVLP